MTVNRGDGTNQASVALAWYQARNADDDRCSTQPPLPSDLSTVDIRMKAFEIDAERQLP